MESPFGRSAIKCRLYGTLIRQRSADEDPTSVDQLPSLMVHTYHQRKKFEYTLPEHIGDKVLNSKGDKD